MVCLNENISFNVKSLRNKLTLEMKSFIDDYDHLLKDEKYVLSLKNKIEKKIKDLFLDNYFIYLTMNEDICSFKHKRGKNEGFICSKLIKTNIEDNKKDYLCCTHSKKHIPKKRINKKELTLKNNDKDKIIESIPIGVFEKPNIIPLNCEENKKELTLKNNNKEDNEILDNRENIKMMKLPKIRNKIDLSLKNNNKDKQDTYSCKRLNIYKDYIFNKDYKYETLFKEYSLIDFVINKFKNKKFKNKKFKNYRFNLL